MVAKLPAGHHRLPDNSFLVPTADYLISQIAIYNEHFPGEHDRIQTGFYVVDGKFSDDEYKQRYIDDEGKIPLSAEGTFYVHDIIQHFLWIGATKDIRDLSRLQTKWIWKFAEFVRKSVPDSPWAAEGDRDFTMTTQRILDPQYSGKNIDNLTGFINLMHLPAAKAYNISAATDPIKLDQLLESKFNIRLYSGLSPFAVLDGYVSKTQDPKLAELWKDFRSRYITPDAHYGIKRPENGFAAAVRDRLEHIKVNVRMLAALQ